MAWSFAGDAAGAAIGAWSANVQNKKNFAYQSALQAQAAKLNYDYSLKSAENMPSSTRKGLESAGYNPMLAVQNSTSGANSSWTSAGNFQGADLSNAITQGISNAQSYQRLKNETKEAESASKANEATAENQSSQALNNLEENKWISPKRKAEIANIQGNTMLQEAQIDNMQKQIELGQLGITVQQEANANQADRNRILEKSMPSGRSQSFANYAGGVRNIMSGFGDIIHGRNDYENYYEERQVTNGPKGRSSEKVTSRRSGKRKKR